MKNLQILTGSLALALAIANFGLYQHSAVLQSRPNSIAQKRKLLENQNADLRLEISEYENQFRVVYVDNLEQIAKAEFQKFDLSPRFASLALVQAPNRHLGDYTASTAIFGGRDVALSASSSIAVASDTPPVFHTDSDSSLLTTIPSP